MPRALALDPAGALHELERARIAWLRPPTIATLDSSWRLHPAMRGTQSIEVVVDGQFHSYTYMLEVPPPRPRFAVPPIVGTYVHYCIGSTDHPNGAFRAMRRRP